MVPHDFSFFTDPDTSESPLGLPISPSPSLCFSLSDEDEVGEGLGEGLGEAGAGEAGAAAVEAVTVAVAVAQFEEVDNEAESTAAPAQVIVGLFALMRLLSLCAYCRPRAFVPSCPLCVCCYVMFAYAPCHERWEVQRRS